MSIGAYRRFSDGTVVNDAEVLLSPSDPTITVTSSTPVYIRGEMVCGPGIVGAGDVTSVVVDGVVITPKNDPEGLIPQIADIVSSFAPAKEVCTRYDPRQDGGMTPVLFYDGKPGPQMDVAVTWVRREDGWRVAP